MWVPLLVPCSALAWGHARSLSALQGSCRDSPWLHLAQLLVPLQKILGSHHSIPTPACADHPNAPRRELWLCTAPCRRLFAAALIPGSREYTAKTLPAFSCETQDPCYFQHPRTKPFPTQFVRGPLHHAGVAKAQQVTGAAWLPPKKCSSLKSLAQCNKFAQSPSQPLHVVKEQGALKQAQLNLYKAKRPGLDCALSIWTASAVGPSSYFCPRLLSEHKRAKISQ